MSPIDRWQLVRPPWHLDKNRSWLVPRFQDAASGILIITIQSLLIRQNGLTVLVDACGGSAPTLSPP
jgi:hypothetical protein